MRNPIVGLQAAKQGILLPPEWMDSHPDAPDIEPDCQVDHTGTPVNAPQPKVVPPKESQSNMADSVKLAFTKLKERTLRGDALAGMSTGFPTLDRRLDGLRLGCSYVIGARSGMGKSICALNIALNTAMLGSVVEYYSMEMTTEEQVMRGLFCAARVQSHKMRLGTLSRDDWRDLTVAAKDLSKLNFFWDDGCGLTVEDIAARVATRVKETTGAGAPLSLVVVDHAGLVRGTNQRQPRYEQLTHITQTLKKIAKEQNVAVLALAQINRQLENRTVKDKRPGIADLKGSGSYEEDADGIMLLYREDYYQRDRKLHNGELFMYVDKVREGRPGAVKFHFDGDRCRIDELDNTEENCE